MGGARSVIKEKVIECKHKHKSRAVGHAMLRPGVPSSAVSRDRLLWQ